LSKTVKRGDVIAQEMELGEVMDNDSVTLAFIKLFKNGSEGRVAILWSTDIFTNPELPLPDELREGLVYALRLHADKLESRETDARAQEHARRPGQA
jgi:hypothetical protein